MTVEERFAEISIILAEINAKLDYQSKLFEEVFLLRDESKKQAKNQFTNAVASMEKIIQDNPSLKESPLGNIIMTVVKGMTNLEA